VFSGSNSYVHLRRCILFEFRTLCVDFFVSSFLYTSIFSPVVLCCCVVVAVVYDGTKYI
jgi:hypothetical protein